MKASCAAICAAESGAATFSVQKKRKWIWPTLKENQSCEPEPLLLPTPAAYEEKRAANCRNLLPPCVPYVSWSARSARRKRGKVLKGGGGQSKRRRCAPLPLARTARGEHVRLGRRGWLNGVHVVISRLRVRRVEVVGCSAGQGGARERSLVEERERHNNDIWPQSRARTSKWLAQNAPTSPACRIMSKPPEAASETMSLIDTSLPKPRSAKTAKTGGEIDSGWLKKLNV